MIKSVQGLIKIINEIWDRCKDHNVAKDCLKIQRVIYKIAKLQKQTSSNRHVISTIGQIEIKDFGKLPDLPKSLTNIIDLKDEASQLCIVPDFSEYLLKVVLLHDDVLLEFLVGFQAYLEKVQVAVGAVEAWLLEPSEIVTFLNETFHAGKEKVKTETVTNDLCVNFPQNYVGYIEEEQLVCLSCHKGKSTHFERNEYNYYSGEYDEIKLTCSSASTGLEADGHFYDPGITTLFTSKSMSQSTKLEMDFELDKEEEREKLLSFLNILKTFK